MYMKDIMMTRGGFSMISLSKMNDESDINTSYIWNTEKIDNILYQVEYEGLDIRTIKNSPFKDNDITQRKPNLPFEYTPYELEEIKKCKEDILYFAYNYCHIQTNNGIKLLKDTEGLRDFQEEILISFAKNRMHILMASRQTGKSVTSAIFILWFLLFNSEKNALIVADTMTTTKELVEKFKISLDNLPFFMKPGIKNGNLTSISFDNGSRLISRTTTKKSGIGLSINLLYIDEFAHIEPSKLESFYTAIYPTITSDPNGIIIITSTPNKKNKFYDIWVSAISKKSNYIPLRVDWWQIPGRDEKWKQEKIADLGSVEAFNQEYGLQFFSSDELLLNSKDLKKLYEIKTEYINSSFPLDEEYDYINKYFYFHKKYSNWQISDFKSDKSYYIFSIDTADGIGGDFSVLNIYKAVCLPIKQLLMKKDLIRNELDTVSLVQIATFRSNEIDINDFSRAIEFITYNIFNPENVRILIEMNHKGDIILNRLKQNNQYWPNQIIHTKHTEMAVEFKQGLRLGPTNKIKYCEKFKYLVSINRIIPNDYLTVMELMSFGKTKGGHYRGQNGNDDLAITSINTSAFFDSPQFWDVAVYTFESMPESYVKDLEEQILNINREKYSTYQKYDYEYLKSLNSSNINIKPNSKQNINGFDVNQIEDLIKIQRNFFKS